MALAATAGAGRGAARAQPSGGQVVAGNATLSVGPGALTVTQTSARAIIDWQDFSLAAGQSAKFIQPDALSATLNRVVSGLPSTLAGTLEANGRVFLINPNGVLVGAGARIDTGGFLASTLDVANSEFLAGGDLHFSGDSTAAIKNLGAINALGGDVFLIARQVENAGTIAAVNGTAGLAAGSEVLLTTGGDERLFVQATSLPGTVVNSGAIGAASAELKAAGGNAYALAINNSGLVRATGSETRNGQIWLVASGESTVTDAGTLDASSAVGSGGRIAVTGGRVLLDDGARLDASGATGGGQVFVGGGWQGNDATVANASAVVMQPGAAIDVSATQSGHGGTAVLWSQDYTSFQGSIAAQGGPAGGDGGQVETSSHDTLQALGSVDARAANGAAGRWLLDPRDVTIAATGASGTAFANTFTPTSDSVILASSVATALNGGNDVTITTGATGTSAGDINVNEPVAWTTNNTLTLAAANNVRVNANLTATGATAGLVLTPNAGGGFNGSFSVNNRASITLSGATPGLTIAGQTYTVINSLGVAGDATVAPATPSLQGLAAAANLNGHFALGSNIDATATSGWNAGAGFTPIGTSASPFAGTLDGLGHSIASLSITQPTGTNVGLFGYLGNAGTLRNVGVVDAYVLGKTSVGGLVGYSYGSIHTSFTSGTVTGPGGHLFTSDQVGGLVGTNTNVIDTSYSSASVGGTTSVGGLVGYNDEGTLQNVYATGDVNGATNVGGLVGYNHSYLGGLATLEDTYALGSVSGSTDVGGVVGFNDNGDVIRAYATGAITGTTAVGGLVGENLLNNIYGHGVSSSYWNTETTGQASAVGVENGQTQFSFGRTTAEMKAMASFPDFNITNTGGTNGAIWRIYEGFTTPWLTCFLFPVTLTANSDSKTYNAAAYSGGNGVTYSLASLNPALSGTLAFGGTAQSAVNAGSYTINLSGLYSGQQGYDVIYASGTLTVNKANLTLSGTRAYDGTTIFAGGNLTAVGVGGQTFAVTGAGAAGNLSTKNVQTSQQLASLNSLALGTGNTGAALASNYNALSTASSSVSVTAAALSVSTSDVVKTYDGTTTATGSPVITAGQLFGTDALAFAPSGPAYAFVGKDVGNGNKTVTISGVGVSDGNNGNNYALTLVDNTTSTINKASLTLGGTKVYDGTTAFAGGNLTATGVNGETFALTGAGAAGNLGVKDVQASQLLASVTGLALGSGNSGAALATNYTALSTTGSSVSVTPAALSLTGSRVYDGTTIFAGGNLTAAGVNGESFTITGAGAAGNLGVKDVQTNQLLASVTGLALGSGNSGAALATNYNALATTNSSVSVTPKPLTIAGFASDDKIYNGTTAAVTATPGTLTGVVPGDTVGFTNTGATFDTKNVGTGKTVTLNGVTLTGGDLADYTYTATTTDLSDITPATLTYTANLVSRLYGSANPSLNGTVTGFANGETTGTATTGSAAFTTTATPANNVGSYAILGSGLTANNGNYVFVQAAGNATALTINPAPLTITADNKSRAINTANPTLTASYSGFVNSETPAIVSGLSLATTAVLNSPGGSYPITPSGATAPNYTVSFVPGTLTVAQDILTITADNKTKTYGASLPAFTATYTGLLHGDTSSVVTGLQFSTTASAGSNVGTYTITPFGATAPSYVLTYVPGTLTINPAALTITANNASRLYGGSNPVFSASYSGLVNGDTPSAVGGLSIGTGATTASNVGSYAIVPSGATAANYSISYLPGTLSVTPALLTVTAANASKLYGAANPAFSATFGGFVNGDTSAVVSGLTFSTTAGLTSPIGTYPITPVGATAQNYTLNFLPGALTIAENLLTIAADNKTKTYGAPLPAFTATYTGLANGDTPGVVTGLQFSTTATVGANVGTYTITPFGATSPNYSIVYVPGSLTITAVALTITANNATRLYGAANPALTATFAGFVNGDTTSVVSGLSLATTATTASHVGSYPIAPSGATAANYTIAYVPGTLGVTPATLTVTAADAARAFGVANPDFSAAFSGFVNGDTSAAVSGLALTTPATTASIVGDYPITPAGAKAADYTFNYVLGTLHVTAPILTVATTPIPVETIDSQPVITPEFAVIVQDGRPTLVSRTSDGGTSDGAGSPSGSIDGQLAVELGQVTGLPRLSGIANLSGAAADRGPGSIGTPNFGSFQFVTSLDNGPAGSGSGGGVSATQLNEPGLYRETSVNMGGYKVIYHEALADAREQARTNTALGSSYREFLDSEHPRVDLVRATPDQQSGEPTNRDGGNKPKGTL